MSCKCTGCSCERPRTNHEKLKNMSVQELAEFFSETVILDEAIYVYCTSICPKRTNRNGRAECSEKGTPKACADMTDTDFILAWLSHAE